MMTVTTILPETTPRSLEVLLTTVRAEVKCPHCFAPAGQRCPVRHRGVHLARFVRAFVLRQITVTEMAAVLAAGHVHQRDDHPRR
jgi:hypothetical protein